MQNTLTFLSKKTKQNKKQNKKGAGFVVVLTGSVMTMPGLPKKPNALKIDVDEEGNITGLF